MSQINYLSDAKRTEALEDAVQRRLPAVLSVRGDDGWTAHKTRFLSQQPTENTLIFEYPLSEAGQHPPEFVPGNALGCSFRRGHKKCLFASNVVQRTQLDLDGRTNVSALAIASPEQIQQLQRRAYNRAVIPTDQPVHIDIWEGGLAAESRARKGEIPVYPGHMVDVSAGGVSILLPEGHDPQLRIGDTVGCRFCPDPAMPSIAVNANFRQSILIEDGQVRLGFQIIGLEATPDGAAVLQLLAEWVRQLMRVSSAAAKRPA